MKIKAVFILTIILFTICHSVNAQRNNLLIELNFEDPSQLEGWFKETCCSYSFNTTDAVKRSGNFAARFELRKSDPIVHNSKRSELTTTRFRGYERWYGLSMFFPSTFTSDIEPENVVQWHATPDFDLGENWRSPPIAITVLNDSLYIDIIWAVDKVNTMNTISGRKRINLGFVKKNEWIDWVFHMRFSHQGDGLIEVWKNKEQVLSLEGPNYYNDQLYPYFKFGNYKWRWTNVDSKSIASTRFIYFDDIRIGSHCASYNDVAP